MVLLEEELDLTNSKIVEIEKNLAIMQGNIYTMSEQIKEVQKYLIMLAKNQGEITKKVSHWPFIAVPTREGE